ncbi:MAG: hypothetical protein LBE98_01845, partial [Puniceicoccales bacterium]|nr:hypothetical protein [Puniceicoccales bacterium]
DAAAAGYKTMSVIVGKTPQRVYARNERTLYEIQGILSQPDLLSGDEMGEEQEAMKANFRRLGFDEEMAEKIYTGFHVAIIHETGYVMGNEKQRQEALRNSIERNRAAAGSFQSCQPPDKAKIAGAEALKDLSSLLQTIKTCAARCTGFTLEKTRRNSRKQVIEEILDFCNKSEYQVTSLEWCREGNNANRSDRIYDPLPSGLSPILSSIMGVRTVSVDRLQELAKDHGPELVEQMVKTVYRTRPESRLQLKAAYDAYCDANGKPPIDFDGLLLNDDLRKICNEQKETMELINNDSNLSEDGKRAALEQCQQNMEQKFQTWLSTHKQVEADGSITVDVGHIKIMVSDEEQLKHVTLKSLSCLTVYHQFGPSS